MKPLFPFVALGLVTAGPMPAQNKEEPAAAPIYEQRFEKAGDFFLQGEATVVDLKLIEFETGAHAVALNSASKSSQTDEVTSAVDMKIDGITAEAGEWLRFSFAAMPQKNFAVKSDEDLLMKVKYFAKGGTEPLDGVVKEIYPAIQADRKDIDRNGYVFKNGAVAWPRHAFDFRLPFNGIDTLQISINVQRGTGQGTDTSLLIDDVRVERIAMPASFPAPTTGKNPADPSGIDATKLLPLGGKWFYFPRENEKGAPRHFDAKNLDRLVYKTGSTMETPFAMARGTWLRRATKTRSAESCRKIGGSKIPCRSTSPPRT